MKNVQSYLDKLQAFDSKLPKDVSVAVKQHVPEVVHLTGSCQNICKLGVINKPGRK